MEEPSWILLKSLSPLATAPMLSGFRSGALDAIRVVSILVKGQRQGGNPAFLKS